MGHTKYKGKNKRMKIDIKEILELYRLVGMLEGLVDGRIDIDFKIFKQIKNLIKDNKKLLSLDDNLDYHFRYVRRVLESSLINSEEEEETDYLISVISEIKEIIDML